MKISACIKVFLTLVATCFWHTGNSQQYPDSLIKYLGIAAKNNPLVLQKFSEYQASLQKIPQVGTLPDPELSLGVFLQPMELINGNQVADLRLMQMFPWFGVLKSARDEMSLMAKAKFELFRDAKIQLYYDIQRTWYELYKLRKNISISEKNVEILKIIERLALVRFKSAPTENEGTASAKVPVSSSPAQNTSTAASGMQTMSADQNNSASSISGQTSSSMQSSSMGQASGSIGLSDIYTIQIEEGDLENNIALLKNRQSTVTAQFNSYLNRPVSSPVYIPDTITIDSLDFSLIAVSDSMLANNPMLDMLDFEMQSIDARKKMVTRMGYPMVGIGLNYSLIDKSNSGMAEPSMNGKDMMMPMLTVTLPVYRSNYNAMNTEADLLKDASSRNYQFISNSLQTEYYQAIQLYQDASRRVKLYDNQYTLASKSFDLMLKNFTVASAGLTDVLRIRQQTLDYEFKQSEAMADFNIAVAWLKRLGNMEIGIIR
ncbi:MAG: TolC family protein [Bacteroidales bacterium]|nr:TolC family protein [Bacteroidales bacterium]